LVCPSAPSDFEPSQHLLPLFAFLPRDGLDVAAEFAIPALSGAGSSCLHSFMQGEAIGLIGKLAGAWF
jgi:hypothetical protein